MADGFILDRMAEISRSSACRALFESNGPHLTYQKSCMNLEAAEMDKTQTVALVFLQVLLAEWFLGDSINPKQLSKIQFKSITVSLRGPDWRCWAVFGWPKGGKQGCEGGKSDFLSYPWTYHTWNHTNYHTTMNFHANDHPVLVAPRPVRLTSGHHAIITRSHHRISDSNGLDDFKVSLFSDSSSDKDLASPRSSPR